MWWRTFSDGSQYEELVLDISRELRPLVGRIRKDKHKGIAMFIKVLTETRTFTQARDYLKSEEGKTWCKC